MGSSKTKTKSQPQYPVNIASSTIQASKNVNSFSKSFFKCRTESNYLSRNEMEPEYITTIQKKVEVYAMDFLKEETVCCLSTNFGETILLETKKFSKFSAFARSYHDYVWKSFTLGHLLVRNFVKFASVNSDTQTNLEVVNIDTNQVVCVKQFDVVCSGFLRFGDFMLAPTYQGTIVKIGLMDFEIVESIVPSLTPNRYSVIHACQNGKYFLIGSYERDLTFVGVDDMKEVKIIDLPEGIWSIVEYKQDCYYLGGAKGNVYHFVDQEIKSVFDIHTSRVTCMIYQDDLLYTFSMDSNFVIFDTARNSVIKRYIFNTKSTQGSIYVAKLSRSRDVIYFCWGPHLFKFRLETGAISFDQLREKVIDVRFEFV